MRIKQIINAIRFRGLHLYALVLIIILAFALMVAFSSYFMTNIVGKQLADNALAALDYLETNIATDLKEPRTLLGGGSETVREMLLHGATKEEVHTYLNEITEYLLSDEEQLADLDGFFGYFDVFGGVLLDGQNRTPPENFNPTERPWYKEAAAAGGEIVFLQPYLSVMSQTPTTVVAYGRALLDNDGKLLGVLALNMNFERVKSYIINANLGKVWFGILLNEQHEFIFHREPRLEGTKFEDVNSDTARLVAELKSGHDNVSEFRMRNYLNIPSITFIRKLENGWYLGIVTPEAEYFKEVRKVKFILILLGSALSVIFSIILFNIIKEKQKADIKINEAIMANSIKSDFLATMSHEIRSPMNVILGITEMQLEKEGLPPDTTEALSKMHNASHLLLNIINDILDLSKIESGKMELIPVEYDVTSLINDTIQLNLMRFYDKHIKFTLKVDENVPVTLFGDALRIKQILNNILSNAFKYTESGDIILSVSAGLPSAEDIVPLVLCVSDTGSGMTQEQISKLFDNYSRFNLKANRKIEGAGLGMSITKHFVDIMKGEIIIKSKPGIGSDFTIRLPQGYVDSAVLGAEGAQTLQKLYLEKKVKERKMPKADREYMPYGKILVVDDMEPNIYVANVLLAPYGLSIDSATSGAKVIEKIKSGMRYDIIFMDHYMPDMDGMETTKNIRGLGYKSPIVALTANALVGQEKIFLENGFDGFISKPIDTRQLDIILNRFIRDKYPVKTVEAARSLKKKLAGKKNDAEPDLSDLSHLKALIVDDFLPNSSLTAGLLEEYKIQADCLLSGQEAVERIKSGEPKYDFILMDLMMPEMDGMEATKLIRSIGTKYASTIPIIALTAIITTETANQEKMLLDNGFQAVLYKPLTISSMEEFIKNWVLDKILNTEEKYMEIDIPGVDVERVKQIYGDKTKVFLNVLRSYLSVVPEALEKMSKVSQETLPSYVTSVHGVKSVSDSIGAEEARKMALELEMLGKAGDISGVLAKNGALIQYVKNLMVNIQNWLATNAEAQ